MDLEPSPRQSELIALARRLARERFAPRAERHDREASFPFDDYDDLRAAGLLGLCVPTRHGGLGADYELKRYPLERYAHDARAGALMRPWTQEIATQQAWEAALGLDRGTG